VSNERAKGGSNVTLRDVARKAAVHPGTVSRALNVETRALVNEETAQRVIDAAQELGYKPNPIARGLKTNRSYTVGVLIPDLTNPLFPGVIGFPIGGWLSDVAVRRGIGRKRLVVVFTALQCALTVAFGLVITGGAPSVWLMAALLFGASTFFNAMQPIAQAMIADIADPAHHGAAFGMNNLIGETGAVLSPAVSGVLRDATGAWSAAVFLDAGLIACAVVLFLFVRESAKSQVLGRRQAQDRESRLGPRLQPSQRTPV
jgi:MFS family permease